MQKISVLLFCCLLFYSCRQVKKNSVPPVVKNSVSVTTLTHDTIPMPLDSTQELDLPWADSLVWKYIEESKDPFIKDAKKNKTAVSFIYDGPEKRDNATYLVFKLGEDFEDHYVTNQWIYIDSIAKTIYRYDLPNDSLIKWR
jgi:hypothetical protein